MYHDIEGHLKLKTKKGIRVKYIKHESVETPHGNNLVWRYMAHWKLESLINDGYLYFPNAKKLTDEYEVTIPSSIHKQDIATLGLSYDKLKKLKAPVYTNCWSMRSHESYALWKIYLGGERNGVAIRSTVSLLRKSIETSALDTRRYYIGKVKYRDYIQPEKLNSHSLITTKKLFYDFEKELRLYYMFSLNYSGLDSGFKVPVNVKVMVNRVYISPFADENYKIKVTDLLKDKGVSIDKLRNSEIRDT